MNIDRHWLIFLLLNNTSLLDNTLNVIIFTQRINKSDQTGLKQHEDFPKEELKSTQSTIEWENKGVVFY